MTSSAPASSPESRNPRSLRAIVDGRELLTAPGHMTVAAAAKLMRERRVGAILVMEYSRLSGIFTERDALFRVLAESRDATTTLLATVMTPNPKSIHPDRLIGDALAIMHQGRFRHVPEVEDGRPIGVISSRDAMGGELEQFMYSLIVEDHARDVLA